MVTKRFHLLSVYRYGLASVWAIFFLLFGYLTVDFLKGNLGIQVGSSELETALAVLCAILALLSIAVAVGISRKHRFAKKIVIGLALFWALIFLPFFADYLYQVYKSGVTTYKYLIVFGIPLATSLVSLPIVSNKI